MVVGEFLSHNLKLNKKDKQSVATFIVKESIESSKGFIYYACRQLIVHMAV